MVWLKKLMLTQKLQSSRFRVPGKFGWRVAGGVVLLSAALLGCRPADTPVTPSLRFENVDISDVNYGKHLNLMDLSGKPRDLASFNGKVVALFFGYTQCPDVCPTALQDWTAVKQALGADGATVQIVFVTLDPERDTPELMKAYLAHFDPEAVGLYGTPEQTQAAAKEFKVFYQKVAGSAPGRYTLDHTAASYVLDKQGRLRVFVRQNAPLASVVHDVKQLL